MADRDARAALEAAYREHARAVRATLVRVLGGFDAAEEALHDAFAAAAEQWPRDGAPESPHAWLVSTGRFKTINRWRRQSRTAPLGASPWIEAATAVVEPTLPEVIRDDELRLIFTCCHSVLAPEARVALTLREVVGLTTEEIARAYLVSPATIGQRIVRAKAKLREEGVAYEVPGRRELPARLESVLSVVYLVFNEGYAATEGPSLLRPELCLEAVRLGRQLSELVDEPEVLGLLALMLLHESRRAARVDDAGDLVLLERQDRTRWDRRRIDEARALLDRALAPRRVGPYLLQAAIAAVHADAPSDAATDWAQIVGLYDVLARIDPSPVVQLNRAAALSRRDGPEAGLSAIDAILPRLDGYHLAHAARGEMLRRLDRVEEARAAFHRALGLALQPAEQRFLARRIAQLS